jgi:hypothetical protein
MSFVSIVLPAHPRAHRPLGAWEKVAGKALFLDDLIIITDAIELWFAVVAASSGLGSRSSRGLPWPATHELHPSIRHWLLYLDCAAQFQFEAVMVARKLERGAKQSVKGSSKAFGLSGIIIVHAYSLGHDVQQPFVYEEV